MEATYNVLIVGAGKIAAFFDNINSKSIITHAHAFKKNKGFNLIGFVDTDYDKAKLAAKIWGVESFNSLEDAFLKNTVDIVTIAVPDEDHYNVLKKVLEYEPKLVLLEKPITKKINEAEEVISILRNKKTNILVNYSRRFINEYERIKEEIVKNVYGNFVIGTCYYGKGFVHNGSHAVDLIRFLFGDITEKHIRESIYDYYEDDPSVSAELTLKNGKKFYLQAINCKYYTTFGMDIFFEKGRIKFEDSDYLKIEKFIVKENELFSGYKNLVKTNDYKNDIDVAMENAVKNIYNFLEKGENLKCTFQDGYEALKICVE